MQMFRYFSCIMEGIQFLHNLRIWHGDVDSCNVMLDEASGDVKIIDFGNSQRLYAQTGSSSMMRLMRLNAIPKRAVRRLRTAHQEHDIIKFADLMVSLSAHLDGPKSDSFTDFIDTLPANPRLDDIESHEWWRSFGSAERTTDIDHFSPRRARGAAARPETPERWWDAFCSEGAFDFFCCDPSTT